MLPTAPLAAGDLMERAALCDGVTCKCIIGHGCLRNKQPASNSASAVIVLLQVAFHMFADVDLTLARTNSAALLWLS